MSGRGRGNMAHAIMLAISVILLSIVTSSQAYKLSFPKYSYRDHPIYRHKQFKDTHFRPAPVIMKRYIKSNHLDLNDTHGMIFTVGTAEYLNFPDDSPLGDPLDSLYTSAVTPNTKRKQMYLEVNLNSNARVFLAVVKLHMYDDDELAKPRSFTGLGGKWRNLRGIQSKDGQPIKVGSRSRGTAYELPARAFVVEAFFRRNETIHLPTPRLLKVDSKEIIQYFLFFAKPGASHRPAVAFNYPETPNVITDLVRGRRLPIRQPILPNEQCPEWLHDLYRTRSRDIAVAQQQRELTYWRTWHPIVDPLYWCYFDHEHGSFPGRYKPIFDYTAWKTPDPNTSHGRQDESDEGFKVHSLLLHDQRKYVIITAHMQCAKSRRFHTRHHTMTFAVLDEKWRLQMEFHMKADFGLGIFVRHDSKRFPRNNQDKKIMKELGYPLRRFRRFNVINLDDYPRKLNRYYRLRMDLQPTMQNKDMISNGFYERWEAPLNMCQTCKKGKLDAFIFDIRNAATGMKHVTDSGNAPMTKLKGDSINRMFVIAMSDVLVGPMYCKFQGTTAPRNIFYTDPYFKTTFREPGKNRLRQFIRAGAQSVIFKIGQYTPVDPWAGHYELTPRRIHRRSLCNIEGAVLANIN